MDLKPGDLFLTNSTNIISKSINFIQRWWSLDNKSTYSHAGIIVDKTGKTFEAKFKGLIYSNINEISKKSDLLIVRHSFMSETIFNKSFERLKYHTGMMYPFHRLFLHIIPPLAKIFAKDKAVCSELVGQLLYQAEFLYYWKGINPDDLHEIFLNWKHFEIIHKREAK